MRADTLRVEIKTVSGTTRLDFDMRRAKRWAARSIELVDTGLNVIIGLAVIALMLLACAVDSLPLDVFVYWFLGGMLVLGLAALGKWAIKPEGRRR